MRQGLEVCRGMLFVGRCCIVGCEGLLCCAQHLSLFGELLGGCALTRGNQGE